MEESRAFRRYLGCRPLIPQKGILSREGKSRPERLRRRGGEGRENIREPFGGDKARRSMLIFPGMPAIVSAFRRR